MHGDCNVNTGLFSPVVFPDTRSLRTKKMGKKTTSLESASFCRGIYSPPELLCFMRCQNWLGGYIVIKPVSRKVPICIKVNSITFITH